MVKRIMLSIACIISTVQLQAMQSSAPQADEPDLIALGQKAWPYVRRGIQVGLATDFENGVALAPYENSWSAAPNPYTIASTSVLKSVGTVFAWEALKKGLRAATGYDHVPYVNVERYKKSAMKRNAATAANWAIWAAAKGVDLAAPLVIAHGVRAVTDYCDEKHREQNGIYIS